MAAVGRRGPGADACGAPQFAPGAKRRGTTTSGVASTPSQGGDGVVDTGRDPLATEAVTNGGTAALNPPLPDDKPGRSLAADVPGINDPNYSARTYSDKGSPDRRGKGGSEKPKRKANNSRK